VRTKGGENAKRQDGVGAIKEIDIGEMVKRREVQVEVQKSRKAEAKKREEMVEAEKKEVEKKGPEEEQKRIREEKKKRLGKNGRVM